MENANVELANNRQLSCTWQPETDLCADLTLVPGITLEYLKGIIATGRLHSYEAGGKTYIYFAGKDCSNSQIILAAVANIHRIRINRGTITESPPEDPSDEGHDTGVTVEPSDLMRRGTLKKEAIFGAADAVDSYVSDRPFPTNNHLERAVWARELRGKVARDVFREVCNYLRQLATVNC